jgi:hypothetical protein
MRSKLFALLVFMLWAVLVSEILSEAEVFAQYVDTAWVRTYDGPAGEHDVANAIAVDNSGNIYVTGISVGSGTGDDYATVKYYPDGSTAWVKGYAGSGDGYDESKAIAVDGDGNVYVTGVSSGSGTSYDYATIKYNPSGDTVWVRRYDGPASSVDEPFAVAVDASGNVYVTGCSYGSGTDYDYATVKYKPNGDTAWVRRYNGPENGSDQAQALALDGSGNVYVTGWSWGGSSTGEDYATVKYNASGDTVWVRTYNGSGNSADRASVMATDAFGNVYVTGHCVYSEIELFYTTIKYYSDGTVSWMAIYNAPPGTGAYPRAIIVDGSGNVFMAATSYDEVTDYNYLTIKYLPNGDTAWVRRYNGPVDSYDQVSDMASDNAGNVYVTGDSYGEGQNSDYATVKYDLTGKQVWVARYDGPQNLGDSPHAIAVDQSNHVLVTGASFFSESYDYATIKYFQYDSIPFAPAVNYGTGDGPASVFCADLDEDGDLDLAIANIFSNKVSILKNYGDGTFQTKTDYDVGGGPIYAFCADLDGDGDLDLATTNHLTNNVSILKNNGDGTFQDSVNYPVGNGPRVLFCADLDGDGDLDLALPNWDANNVSILKNRGDGTFQTKVDYPAGDHPHCVFCADLDGDGDLDLAVANEYGNSVSILKNNGDGTFRPKVDYPVANRPRHVFCGDLDGDSFLDLVVPGSDADSISILKNNGTGVFQPTINYQVGDGPYAPFCVDLDGDLDLDIVTSNIYGVSVSIMKNNGNGSFQSPVNYGAIGNHGSVFCADLDGDGDMDLAVTNYDADSISILKNLTQVPANQPPWAFSLISPEDQDTIFGSIMFRWQTPYDPNFGDQIRYDLYISTSPGFEPPYTIINSDLAMSKFIAVLDSGAYYWKVKAKDNWGAERWSTQTWRFEVSYLTDTLRVMAYSPVDLIVTDPIGDSIGLGFNTIPGADYDTTQDIDSITIPNRLVGGYMIRVFAEPVERGVYSIGIRIDGSGQVLLTMNQPSPPPGEVDTLIYNALWCMPGDANGDWIVSCADVVYLINYLFISGPAPDPLGCGDANCDGIINSADIVHLINFLFIGGPAPGC